MTSPISDFPTSGDIGSFSGLFVSFGSDHLQVSSIDGVGTKLKVAHLPPAATVPWART